MPFSVAHAVPSTSVRVLRVQQVTSKRAPAAAAAVPPPAPAPGAALFAIDDDWSGGGDALGFGGATDTVDQAAAALQSTTLDDLEALVQRHEAKAAAAASTAPPPAPTGRPSYAAAAAASRPIDAPAADAEPPASIAAEGPAPNWFAPYYVYVMDEPSVNVKAVGADHALGTAAPDPPPPRAPERDTSNSEAIRSSEIGPGRVVAYRAAPAVRARAWQRGLGQRRERRRRG